jgi:hypothetical protein
VNIGRFVEHPAFAIDEAALRHSSGTVDEICEFTRRAASGKEH